MKKKSLWLLTSLVFAGLFLQSFIFSNAADTNLALNKTATQSGTYGTAVAGRAVDGSTNGDFTSNSVTHTSDGIINPWWQVDLGSTCKISSIKLWNRTDGCSNRLQHYTVSVLDANYAVVWIKHKEDVDGYPNPSIDFPVQGIGGRYVKVQLANPGPAILSLAEVQVYGTQLSNLALKKTATQSSTWGGAVAGRATDGNTNGYFANNSVTHTNLEARPWWQVDLGSTCKIKSIILWNRLEAMNRLQHYTVSVVDSAGNTIWSAHRDAAAGYPNPRVEIPTGTALGRYVKVQLADTNCLSLAEVVVLGEVPSNLAYGKVAYQSSTAYDGVNGRAVDGITNGAWANYSVTSTNLEAQPWWRVDLLPFSSDKIGSLNNRISSIKLWNRTDSCMNRLQHYTVSILDNHMNVVWSVHKELAAGYPNPNIEFLPAGAVGRYVKVQLADTNYLSLAEVEVFGYSIEEDVQDVVPPTKPGPLINLRGAIRWSGSTDNIGVTAYDVYVNGKYQKSVPAYDYMGSWPTTCSVNLPNGTTSLVEVYARDKAGNVSDSSRRSITVTSDGMWF